MEPPTGDLSSKDLALGRFFLLLLIIPALFFRFWDLGQIPPGAYVDETSIGYNAYSILQTGADEHGVAFPLFFKAFGEYKNPVFIYSLVPLIRVFDLSPWTIRLGAALFGLGTAILLGLIVVEGVGGIYAGAWAFILAALTPWLFSLSRVSFEVVSFPFFLVLAWWSWLKATKSSSSIWFLLSWSAWGVSIFTYSTARLMIPVLIVALVGCYFRELKSDRIRCLIGSVPFALCMLLLSAWSIRNPGSLTGRFEEISIWKDNPDLLTSLARFLSNYLSYFSPQFLFLSGDPNLRHHTGHGGELFLIMFPALLVGLIYAWQYRHQALERFTLLGFLLFPLAASLTEDHFHALRTANATPFILLLMVWGFEQLWERLRSQRALVVAFATFVTVETGAFYYDYFVNYPDKARTWFNAGLPQAVKTALGQGHSDIYYSPLAFRNENFESTQPYIQPYVQFLFFGKLDPAIYHGKGLAGFHIYPYQNGMSLPKGSILLLKDGEEVFSVSGKVLVLDNPDLPPPKSDLIAEVRLPSRDVPDPPSYRIYRIL
jgi:4-amino-4-deoxy-L-arabinose transferase-like glycosyltransferase